jgi:PKD repeat protein
LVVSEKTKRGLELSVTAVFILALLLVGTVLIFSDGTASAKQIATLRLIDGEVAVQHGDDALQPGEEGESLREGDIVHTGSDGRAAIEYFDGSLTRLDYGTMFSLETLETLRNPAESTVILGGQTTGNSYNRVAELTDAGSRFEVETPTATASVRGTVYALLVDQGSTTIAVIEGLVTASGASGSVDVSAGKMVVVDADGSIGPIQDISQELLDSDWFTFNECELDGTRECMPDDTESEDPSGGSTGQGEGGLGSVPPNSDAGTGTGDGSGDGGGTTGDGPPPPPQHNQPPLAGFSASPHGGPAPLDVEFSDSSSDPDGDPISRHWSFGDGSSRSGGQSPSHTYVDPGEYTVTLTVSDPRGETDSKSKVIEVGAVAADFDHIVIAPSQATIEPGGSQAYTAEAFDTDGDSMGKVTADTNFSIGPDGSCQGHTCTATKAGAHTVTGTYAGDSDAATLVVEGEEPPPPACPHYGLSFHSRPPETQRAGHQFNVQIKVDVLEGGSNTGPLTIVLQLQGGSFSGGDTSATWTGQGTMTFNHLTIDEAGTYGLTGVADCATPTATASITITDSPGKSDPEVALGPLVRRQR